MFSALKKLVSNQDASPCLPQRSGMPQAIDKTLQRRFAKGVHYNMKMVIKGDRNVGKTCLFHRLQGEKFRIEYIPTDEIQVCHIQWNYKATDDIVKVEIWDVVDKGKKRKPLDGLKLSSSAGVASDVETSLDAEFIDVYKGSNGVIMILDMTKQWTWDYVQRELPKVPKHIPVLVLNNHLDMKHHRVISEDQVKCYLESLDRPSDAPIRYSEASMSNGFGLKFLHKFFNVPFLQLQRQALLGQLERNQREMEATCEELDLLLESDEANYELFVDRLGQRRRQIADSASSANLSQGGAGPSPGKITGGGVLPATLPKSVSLPADITNTILSRTSKTPQGARTSPVKAGGRGEEFECEIGGNELNQFLSEQDDDEKDVREVESDSDDDSPNGNPLVTQFQDELDPEDLQPASFISTKVVPSDNEMPVKCAEVSEDKADVSSTLQEEEKSADEKLASPTKEFTPDPKLEREDPDGTSSPAEWQPQDLDYLEKFGQVSVSEDVSLKDEEVEVEQKKKREHRPSRKSKKEKGDKEEKKSKKKKKKEEPSVVEEDPLEAFLNDKSQYECL